jgi:hypothetical protein
VEARSVNLWSMSADMPRCRGEVTLMLLRTVVLLMIVCVLLLSPLGLALASTAFPAGSL